MEIKYKHDNVVAVYARFGRLPNRVCTINSLNAKIFHLEWWREKSPIPLRMNSTQPLKDVSRNDNVNDIRHQVLKHEFYNESDMRERAGVLYLWK